MSAFLIDHRVTQPARRRVRTASCRSSFHATGRCVNSQARTPTFRWVAHLLFRRQPLGGSPSAPQHWTRFLASRCARSLNSIAGAAWIVLVAWPAAAALPGVGHVVVIGVDGLNPNGIRVAATPNFDRLIRTGAHTFHARAVMPTSSSPNWASMIMGAGPEQHGVTSNDWQPDKFEFAPVAVGPGGIFPTIFGVLREQRPDAVMGVFHDWKDFRRLLETNSPNVLKHVKDAIETAHEAADYLRAEKPAFLFVHFDGVDHAGHGFGWTSPQYYKAVELIDSLTGALLDAIEEAGLSDQTIVLVTADHGGKGKKHGGNSMEELEIPWILNGPGVAAGREIQRPVNTFDTAPTIAFIFGLKPPVCWIGQPVREAFAGSATQK